MAILAIASKFVVAKTSATLHIDKTTTTAIRIIFAKRNTLAKA